MWILPLVGYTGVLLGFGFLTLAIGIANNSQHNHPSSSNSILPSPFNQTLSETKLTAQFTASGLYYLSELVEEHTVFARKLLTRLIYAIILIQSLLTLIDRFPLLLSLVSVVSHGVYMGNLRHFPIVKLTDPVFILSCGKPASCLPPMQTLRIDGRCSPRPRQPLPLVPPFLFTSIAPFIIHLRPP